MKFSLTFVLMLTLPAMVMAAQLRTDLAAQLYEKIERESPRSATGDIIEQALAGKQNDACFNEMKPELESMVRRYSKVDAARDLAVAEYAKHFSAPELQAMIAFADLPIGKKWFSKQPAIAAKAANIAMNHFQQNQFSISQEIMEILDRYDGKNCKP